jgi:hypothetical protein
MLVLVCYIILYMLHIRYILCICTQYLSAIYATVSVPLVDLDTDSPPQELPICGAAHNVIFRMMLNSALLVTWPICDVSASAASNTVYIIYIVYIIHGIHPMACTYHTYYVYSTRYIVFHTSPTQYRNVYVCTCTQGYHLGSHGYLCAKLKKPFRIDW